MTYVQLAYVHLTLIAIAFVLGTFLMLRPKGSNQHRFWGKAYLLLMLVNALITLMMPARVGPQLLGHFGGIHVLSLVALWSVVGAYFAAKSHHIRLHQAYMMGLYVGGILLAGSLTLLPGRLLHQWLFM